MAETLSAVQLGCLRSMEKAATRWRKEYLAGNIPESVIGKIKTPQTKEQMVGMIRKYRDMTGAAAGGGPTEAVQANLQRFLDQSPFSWTRTPVDNVLSGVKKNFSPELLGMKGGAPLRVSPVGEGLEAMALQLPHQKVLKVYRHMSPNTLKVPMGLTAELAAPKEVAPGIYAAIEELARPGKALAGPKGSMTYTRALNLMKDVGEAGFTPYDLNVMRLDQLGTVPGGGLRLLDRGAIVPKGAAGNILEQPKLHEGIHSLARAMKDSPKVRRAVLRGKGGLIRGAEGIAQDALLDAYANPRTLKGGLGRQVPQLAPMRIALKIRKALRSLAVAGGIGALGYGAYKGIQHFRKPKRRFAAA